MSDIKQLIENTDVATRQVLWFYELCKSGIVRFSLKNEEHIKILTDIINKVNDYDSEKYKDEPELIQMEMASRHQLLYLISLQLLKYVEA